MVVSQAGVVGALRGVRDRGPGSFFLLVPRDLPWPARCLHPGCHGESRAPIAMNEMKSYGEKYDGEKSEVHSDL